MNIRTSVLLAGLLLPGIAGAQQANKNNHDKIVNMENNKAIVKALYDESLNKRNMQLLSNYISDEYIGAGGVKGAAGFEAPLTSLIAAFPDIHWELITVVGEGSQVVARWKWTGTQTGLYRNIPATGKNIVNDGMAVYELKEGKIIGSDVQIDRLGFLQALDVLPAEVPLPQQPSKETVQFIDKFLVPADGIAEFKQRTAINRQFIKTLPGFIEDAAYEYTDEKGNLICVTVAKWASKEALAKAKESVQALYREQGFNPAEMFSRLGIAADRGVYTSMDVK
ncbi:ester cyclase [Chitinophaga sp. 22321]|uniref:Ester cyclase n=1 Tax=Chitinophaga hostae TaxID=2831022 RepID=A0ABS5J6X6_9BACT|nr:ester cyclase [Chitinophaga hostae]MBS0030979.1 ester cyclase [Chitinophaga hostae]